MSVTNAFDSLHVYSAHIQHHGSTVIDYRFLSLLIFFVCGGRGFIMLNK